MAHSPFPNFAFVLNELMTPPFIIVGSSLGSSLLILSKDDNILPK